MKGKEKDMKEITFSFDLTEKQAQRLEDLTKSLHEKGLFENRDPDDVFRSLMLLGEVHLIDRKLEYGEMYARGISVKEDIEP